MAFALLLCVLTAVRAALQRRKCARARKEDWKHAIYNPKEFRRKRQ
jgi:hypothetical protein